MPETAVLRLARPPGFEHLSEAELANLILERVRVAEEGLTAERRRNGSTIVGRKGVLAQRWSDRPGTANRAALSDPARRGSQQVEPD